MRYSFRLSLWLSALFIGFVWGVLLSPSQAADRVAIVIGNGNYLNAAQLPNAVPDARSVGQAFQSLGFDVKLGIDLGRQQFLDLLSSVKQTNNVRDVILYFAGHGFQLNNINRLVPVDAKLRNRGAIESETLSLNGIIDALKAEDRSLIILLDACRNNPLPENLQRPEDGRGLAEIATGQNLYVAFATQPGNVSLDGLGHHSPFTQALLTHISRQNISISELMIDIRKDVFNSTHGAQIPWDQSSLRTLFYFSPGLSDIERRAQEMRNGGRPPEVNLVSGLRNEPAAVNEAAQGSASLKTGQAVTNAAPLPQTSASQTKSGSRSAASKSGNTKKSANKAKADVSAKSVSSGKEKNTSKASKEASRSISAPANRPDARAYSMGIFGIGSLRAGPRSQKTEYGTLVCSNPSRRRGGRSCHWE